MKFKDVVRFRNDLFFNGSVEIDCIYDDRDLATRAAGSYVFHSKRAFTKSDDGKIDTIQLVTEVFNRAYSKDEDNPFITVIAGYGSGKSHLCTAVASLFANNKRFLDNEKTLQNIKSIEPDAHDNLVSYLTKPNIVFSINGMNNSDLTMLLYGQIKKYLQISDVSIPLFTDIEEVYNKAKLFVKNNYDNKNFQENLLRLIKQDEYKSISPSRSYLSEKISEDRVFSLVNQISVETTGNRYQIENFLNPSLIIGEVCEKLCGEGKPFDKVIVIFDELGRYIEWIGEKKGIDPSSMQQLYEGVKNSKGKAVFLSFIQFPLTTYFNHLDPIRYAVVSRYVDRFKSARNLYLSTLLETVFANLVEVIDGKYFKDYSNIQADLLRWNPALNNSFVWTDAAYYTNTICNKLRVFHPLTIALLAKLSDYTQKRGPLAILKELLDEYKNAQVEVINSIAPVSVLNTTFKEDILRMEQSGLLKGRTVSIYDELVNRPDVSPHLGAEDKLFLQAILVINLLELKPNSREDYFILLQHITGLDSETLNKSADSLELNLGVIRYDTGVYYHHIVLDSVGQKDFDSFFIRKRNTIKNSQAYYKDDVLSAKIRLIYKDELTPFKTALYKEITTLEWEFPQEIIDIRSNVKRNIGELIREQQETIEPNKPRGAMVWVYVNDMLIEDIDSVLNSLLSIAKEMDLENTLIQIGVLFDQQGQLLDHILDRDTIVDFTGAEREKFQAFVSVKEQKINLELKDTFLNLQKNAYFVIDEKLEKITGNYRIIMNQKVEQLYTHFVPFAFDGFRVLNYHNGRNEIIQIIKTFAQQNLSLRVFEAGLPAKTFNRFNGVFGDYGWQGFEDNDLVNPKDPRAYRVFDLIDTSLSSINDENPLELITIFDTIIGSPYGLNIYVAMLMFVYAASMHRDHLIFNVDEKDMNFGEWILHVNDNDINRKLVKSTVIKYFDIRKREESVSRALQKVLDEQSIVGLESLEKSIGYLLEETFSNTELNSKVLLARDKLAKAKALRETYEIVKGIIDKFWGFINDPEDGIPDILKGFDGLKDAWENLTNEVKIGLLKFPYDWKCEYENVVHESARYIDKNFKEWFSRNQVPRDHNVDSYIAFNKKLVKGLYAFGLSDHAQSVNENIRDITRDFNLTTQINNRIAELAGQNLARTFEECTDFREKVDLLRQEIDVYDLKIRHKKEYFKTLDFLNSRIDEQVNKLNDEIASIWDFLADEEIETMVELDSFISRLSDLLERIGVNHSDYVNLHEILENANSIKIDLLEIEHAHTDRMDVKRKMEQARERFNDNIEEDPESLCCKALFDNHEAGLYRKIEDRTKTWMSRLPAVDSLLKKSDIELEKTLAYVNEYPSFLSEQEVEVVKNVKFNVLRQLDGHMKAEIVSLFDNIATREKKVEVIEELQLRI
jgi:hypothetical protein